MPASPEQQRKAELRRTLINAAYDAGFYPDEIAEALHTTPGTVSVTRAKYKPRWVEIYHLKTDWIHPTGVQGSRTREPAIPADTEPVMVAENAGHVCNACGHRNGLTCGLCGAEHHRLERRQMTSGKTLDVCPECKAQYVGRSIRPSLEEYQEISRWARFEGLQGRTV